LRRVLSDPATPAPAKSDLARALLEGKVSGATAEVVDGAVQARWSSARDIADGLERLSVLAQVFAAERSGQLDELEDELFRFNRIVDADPDLRRILVDRGVAVDRKRELVHQLLDGRATEATISLVEQAVSARHRSFDTVLTDYQNAAANRRSQLLATVISATPLTPAESERLSAALQTMYGRGVHLNVEVDPSVVGGVRVMIGDEVIDGTLETRLADARRELT
jgi:F-type H+-transporting ATPase subunit delta